MLAVSLAVCPAVLIGIAIYSQAWKWTTKDPDDLIAPAWGLILGAGLVALGPLCYLLSRLLAGKTPRLG